MTDRAAASGRSAMRPLPPERATAYRPLATIKTKLLAVLFVLTAALAATAAVGWISLRFDDHVLRTIHDDRVVCLKQLKTVSDMYAVNIAEAAHKIRSGGMDWDAGREALDAATAEIGRQWTAYLATYLTPEEEQLVAETKARMRIADASVAKLKGLVAARDRAGLDLYAISELYPSIEPVLEKVGELVDLQLRVASEQYFYASHVDRVGRAVQGALVVFGLIAVAFGIWVIVGRVIRPLGAMTETMTRLAGGDLAVPIPGAAQRDEIGFMARAVGVFREATIRAKDLQEQNQQQRAWLQRVLDEMPVGVTIFDEHDRVTLRNSAMNRMHPHPFPDRVLGRDLHGLLRDVMRSEAADGRADRQAELESFAGEIEEKLRSAPEGRFEATYPHGVDIDSSFRWIDGKRLIVIQTDVSALREAERRSTLAEKRLHEIVEGLPIGFAYYDRDERVVIQSERLRSLVPPAEDLDADPARQSAMLRRLAIDEVVASDGGRAEREAVADFLADYYRAHAEGQLRARLVNGRHVSIHFRNLAIGGRAIAVTDVTDFVTAQQAAQTAEQRLSNAVLALPVSFALFARDRTLLLFNEEFRREYRCIADLIRVGVNAGDIIGAYMDASHHPVPVLDGREGWSRAKPDPARRDEYLAALTRMFLRLGTGAEDIERDYGTYRPTSVELPNGEIVRVSTDITDLRNKESEIRRLGESALAKRTALLQEIIDSLPQAIAVFDGGRRLRFANRSLSVMIGNHDAVAQSWGLDRIGAALGTNQRPLAALIAGEKELEVVSSDHKPLRLKSTPITTGDTLVVVSDLSEQREAEMERLEQQQRLLQAETSQAIVTLAGSIAHDFNNLLAVILGFSSIALHGSKTLSETQRLAPSDEKEMAEVSSSLSKVIVSAERGRNIVASLNSLTREQRPSTARLDMREIVKDAEQLLRVLFPTSVRLEVRVPDSPCHVSANATQIEQILTNLCVNAVHALKGKAGSVGVSVDMVDIDGSRAQRLQMTEAAARRHGVHAEVGSDGAVDVFVGVLTKGPYCRIRIVDNGEGMTEAVAREIFKPFFTTKGAGGTGLGLSSVLTLVNAHQGGIHVRTQKDVGTAFTIFLPPAKAEQRISAPEPPPAALGLARPESEADMRTETRILVIDDEPLLAELAAKILRRNGYEVDRFSDPMAALNRLQETPQAFDLIITDQTMPTMTGLELIEHIQRVNPGLPIIVCTGRAPDLERDEPLPAGVKSILLKPYEISALCESVKKALAV